MSQVPQSTKQKRGNELRNAPRFPQGKSVANYSISPKAVDMSEGSKMKLGWAVDQVYKVLRQEANHSLEITVTNFDANPTTMKSWLNRACKEMFPSGNRHLSFRFRGSRRNGKLYVSMLYGMSPRKGKDITIRA